MTEDSTSDSNAKGTIETIATNAFDFAIGSFKKSKGENAIAILSLAKSFMRGRFVEDFLEELKTRRNEGRVCDQFSGSLVGQDCLRQVLEAVDEDGMNSATFRLLKDAFFHAAEPESGFSDDVVAVEMLRTIRSLSGAEVVLLLASRKAGPLLHDTGVTSESDWSATIAESSGLRHVALVQRAAASLVSKNLLTPLKHSDASGVKLSEDDRLTDFGVALMAFSDAPASPNR